MLENKLHLEDSAYLRQHAENPIYWQAYSAEVLAKAKELGRPIFLSIGYSTCHWCHVMAEESFSDPALAELLNEQFISIKVDREEHPHVDHLYQAVAAAANGRGGWPLNVFLTPDLNPIFVGTYFPPQEKQGVPSFKEIVRHLSEAIKVNKTQLEDQGRNLLTEIAKPIHLEKKIQFEGHFPGPAAIVNALKNYADTANGGYGSAPKFPHFAFLEWASEQILEGMIPQDLGQHIVETVEKMVMGGMYDHLKGGVHRYSTDAKWLVPHFEKMLYDQAGLLRVLAKTTPFYPSPLLFDAILQTLDYLNSEMVAEDEYFMSAQDADSEGQEGLYFTFTKEEFADAIQQSEMLPEYNPEWEKWFRLEEKGNFQQGLNVISLDPQFKNEIYAQESWETIRKIRHALLEARRQRIPPSTDKKGVASWNFMVLNALCDVIQYSRVPAITQEALKLVHRVIEGVSKVFITTDAEGRHVLRHPTTKARAPLYLEDYVQFCDSQLRLYEVTSTEVFLTNARETLNFILREFVRDEEPSLTALRHGEFLRAPLNDQSFRSPLSTLVVTMTRLSVLFPEYHPRTVFPNKYDHWVQLALSNPVAHGEALRAFTYPLEIYRRIEVPRPWVNDEEFQRLRSHFLGRFVLQYHDRTDEKWQVCNRTECEKQGEGLEELLTTFSANAPEVQ